MSAGTSFYLFALLAGVVGCLVAVSAGSGWLAGGWLAGGLLVFLFGVVRWLAEPPRMSDIPPGMSDIPLELARMPPELGVSRDRYVALRCIPQEPVRAHSMGPYWGRVTPMVVPSPTIYQGHHMAFVPPRVLVTWRVSGWWWCVGLGMVVACLVDVAANAGPTWVGGVCLTVGALTGLYWLASRWRTG